MTRSSDRARSNRGVAAPRDRTLQHAVTLTDADLVLAPMDVEHVSQDYVDWLNDPEVVAQTEQAGSRHTLDSVQAYVASTLRAPDGVMWRLLLAGTHVGNIRLSSIHPVHRRASLGLIIGSGQARGKGLGPRAIELATAHAFRGLELNKVFAGMFASNAASRRAFEKAGFIVEATLRRHAWYDGGFVDVQMMARFRPLEAV